MKLFELNQEVYIVAIDRYLEKLPVLNKGIIAKNNGLNKETYDVIITTEEGQFINQIKDILLFSSRESAIKFIEEKANKKSKIENCKNIIEKYEKKLQEYNGYIIEQKEELTILEQNPENSQSYVNAIYEPKLLESNQQ